MIYNPVLLTVQHYKLTSRGFYIFPIDKSPSIEHHFPTIYQKQPAGGFPFLTYRGFHNPSIYKSLMVGRHFPPLTESNPREVSS